MAFDDSMDVQECTSCGLLHDKVELTRLSKNQGPFTHWYSCPETNEPVLTALVGFGKDQQEMDKKASENLTKAQVCGKYMAATFRQSNGRIILDRVNSKFPAEEFPTCLNLLKGDLEKQVSPPEFKPLQPATGIHSRMMNLFATPEKEATE